MPSETPMPDTILAAPKAGEGRGPRRWAKWLLPLLAVVGLIPIQLPVHVAGVYLIEWQSEFGWTRGDLGLALSLYTVLIVMASPVVGWLVDRFGVRWPIVLSMLMMVGAYVAFALLRQPVWMLYAAFGLLGVVGAGGTAVPFNRAIVQRFDGHLGIALAIAQSATAVSVLASPLLVLRLVEAVGWRQSWMLLAGLPLILIPLLLAGLPRSADSTGARSSVDAKPGQSDVGVDYAQAIRSPRLWLFAFSFGLFYFANAGVMGQFVPIMKDAGVPVAQAVTYQGVLGIAVLVGRLATGHVLDRFAASRVYLGVAIIGAAGFLILSHASGSWILLGIVGVGIALGAEVDIASYMTSRYFGPKNYGKIFGVIYASLVAGGIFSHPVYGLVADATGSYYWALTSGAVFMVIGALLLVRAGPYPIFKD